MAVFEDYDTLYRYLHILFGIMWIGLLYFFNFVNLPLLKFQLRSPVEVKMDDKASAHVVLKALFWFRWAAMGTLLMGLFLLESARRRHGGDLAAYFADNGYTGYAILLGAVLAIIMWFNVWFIIWPNQKVILGNNVRIAGGQVGPEEKAKLEAENKPRMEKAKMASRINTWFSIPMLFGMVFGAHGIGDEPAEYGVPVLALVALLLILVFYSNKK
jgi:uncharacterized membrane protein